MKHKEIKRLYKNNKNIIQYNHLRDTNVSASKRRNKKYILFKNIKFKLCAKLYSLLELSWKFLMSVLVLHTNLELDLQTVKYLELRIP